MTPEGKTAAIILSLAGVGIGGYLIYKYSKGTSAVSQTIIPVKVSSKCTTNGVAEIILSWNTVTGAASYTIVHEGGNIIASGIPAPPYTAGGLAIGNWTVQIEAKDSSGNILATGPLTTLKVCSMPGDPCYSYLSIEEPQWCGANCTG